MKIDEKFISMANSEAEKAFERGDYPAGCIIVRDEKILARASSRGITKNDVTSHAELIAISHACRKLKTRFLNNCTVYTNIEPCLMCAQAMAYARIKKVVYGTEHREYGSKKTFDILKQNGIGKNIEIVSGVDKIKAAELLSKFLKSKIQI